ncbi:MAG: aryl-sulfate sulfotransferase [Lachnospiraceae bacterium]|nr:aryl-sulfate sulfotransferase [Lachnospiraceae bacterium]
MKNTATKVLLIMTIISAVFLCVLLVILMNQGNGDGTTVSKLKEFQQKYEETNTDTKTIAPTVYQEFSVVESEELLYDIDRHTEVYERIEALKRDGSYTMDNPLVIYNPYGVNALSAYVYFETETPVQVSYRVSVQEEGIPTFTAKCNMEEPYATEHEYLLIGLSAGQSNRISLTMEDAEGNSSVRTFYVVAGEKYGIANNKLDVRKGAGDMLLSDGLYAHFGNVTGAKEAVQLYDNDGALRSEFPVLSGSAKRFIFFEDLMYFNVSDTQFVGLDSFGRAKRLYSVDGYEIGKDYCLDEANMRLLILGSKSSQEGKVITVDDRVISLELLTGDVKELVDMGTLLSEYKGSCKKNEEGILDWLGLNSIQIWNETGVLLGAREPSAAFKVKDIYGIPTLDYIIGEEAMFEDTGYEGYLLTKTDGFDAFVGANTFTCVRDELMSSNMYYLYLYDNHVEGTASRPEFDYTAMASGLGSSLKKGTNSYFCKYLVNELAKTWEQLEVLPVDYSGYHGSAQLTEDGHLITDTAGRLAYSEYDENRNLIRKFTAAGPEYLERVFKYTFDGFFFADEEKLRKQLTEEE